MKPKHPLHGLVAATHTPFGENGELNLRVVKRQAAHLQKNGINTVFIGGTTGECSSLSLEERRALTREWTDVAGELSLRVVVHVGSNCLPDARELAGQAQELGAVAVAALAPSYFKPRTLKDLVGWCGEVAAAAPETPFYYYHIPALTGVDFPMPQFLAEGKARIPTLAGMKFTHSDLMAYQFCLRAEDGAWDVPFGMDEYLLGALALGAKGAVGSGFNFAAPIYGRMIRAFKKGDLVAAREEQYRGAQIVKTLANFSYMGAAKAVMGMLGVEVGPARLPQSNLTRAEKTRLQGELKEIGFFEWIT